MKHTIDILESAAIFIKLWAILFCISIAMIVSFVIYKSLPSVIAKEKKEYCDNLNAQLTNTTSHPYTEQDWPIIVKTPTYRIWKEDWVRKCK